MKDGFVSLPPPEQRILKPLTDRKGLPREVDTEYKILENFAQQHKSNPQVQGSINLFTERPPCRSCTDVIKEQCAKMYLNVEVRLYHNNGEITIFKNESAQTFVPKPNALPQNPGEFPRAPGLEVPPSAPSKKKGG